MKVDEADRTRPFAYADPRSLSEAWYDALYGAKAKPQTRTLQDAPRMRAAGPNEPAAPDRGPEAVATQSRVAREPSIRTRATAETLLVDGEETQYAAVRRRTRAANAPAATTSTEAERSDFAFDDGNGGGIKLLVSQRDGEIEVVAICERQARERTADALARARIALGARGIALHTTLREKTEGETR